MPREMIILTYDPNWKNEFQKIKDNLLIVFGALAIEIQHFGSTAINGMPAKPIIDVMVIVTDITKVDALNTAMEKQGYVVKGENGIMGRRYFQMFADDGVNHTQHIHCYEKDNQHAIDQLMFRDYLLIDKDAFYTYKKIKMEASKKFRFSPRKYTEYKSDCVNTIMEKAKSHFKKCASSDQCK